MKNNMVLHLSHTDISTDSRILKELHALEQLDGYKVVAIGVENDEGVTPSSRKISAHIESVRLVTKGFRWLPRALRYSLNILELTTRFFIRAVRIRPKVVHCHDTLVLPAGFLIKLFFGCYLIYDAHELESNKNGQSSLLARGTLFIEKMCWTKIDLLVSVSDSILIWYEENLGKKSNILVLNSPEIEELSENIICSELNGKYFHCLYNISENRLVFIYLGIFGQGRGIEIVLEAFASNSIGADVVFVGYGDLSTFIQSYSDTYTNIHLHKSVPHDQVVPYAKNADIGLCLIENVSLSDYYCLPNKLFEYSFAGIPIISSDFPEIRKIVDHYSLGRTCELKADKILEAIKFFVDHPPSRIDSDLTNLGWSVQADRLVQAYKQLLSSKY